MTEKSFPDVVAERCGHSASDVTALLSAVHVPTIDRGGSPHRLRVTRLAFTGKKAGLLTDNIDFDQRLGNGLWAISSVRNDAGKTSILEIIMWCLRGEPKRLQADVRSWLRTVTLEGLVDEEPFVVTFDDTQGAPQGTLTCGSDVRPFASDAAFADTMSQFMMDRLGFEAFELWVKGQGRATHHWPSYSTVLYLPREAAGAVIGDRAGDGVAQQLLQLFVGVPWARTHSACRAALREAEAQATTQESDKEAFVKMAADAVVSKRAALTDVRRQQATLPSDLPGDPAIAQARANWMSLIAQQSHIVSDLQEARAAATAAKKRADSQRRRLRDVTEAALARRLFHGLNPSKCPRCSVEIGPSRREAERLDHACAICDRQLDLDVDVGVEEISIEDADDEQSPENLQQLVDELEAVAQTEGDRADELAVVSEDLARKADEAEATIEGYSAQVTQLQEWQALETQAIALEAVIAELSQLSDEQDRTRPVEPDTVSLEILRAAAQEAKARRDEEFAEIVAEIDSAILDLARRFGFATLEEAKLNLAAQLRLVKGGASTSFSHQTPGEKLRLRIAVVVALLRVGHEHNVGRHPGLLMIDSIGAEETEPGNLSEFMRELDAVTRELGIETIVASARPEILQHMPSTQQIAVTGAGYLW